MLAAASRGYDESRAAIAATSLEQEEYIVVSAHDPGTTGGLADRVKGVAKTLAGTVTGNEDLKREGELHHEKVEAAETAAELEATAEREQAKAELTARE